MNIGFSAKDEQFRQHVAQWMQQHLSGEFSILRFRGGPGDEDFAPQLRKRWEQELAKGSWIGAGWATEHGGQGLSINQQVIFYEEYARAGGLRHSGATAAIFTPDFGRSTVLVSGILRARRGLRSGQHQDPRQLRRAAQ